MTIIHMCPGEEDTAANVCWVSHIINVSIFHIVLNTDDVFRDIENTVRGAPA